MPIKIRLYELRQQHERENGGFRIPLTDIAKDTGLPYSTLHAWYSGKVTRFDSHVIVKLCDYFDCRISDLLEYSATDSG